MTHGTKKPMKANKSKTDKKPMKYKAGKGSYTGKGSYK